MFTLTKKDLEDYRNMAVAAVAKEIGVWTLELLSADELKGLIKAKSPELLAALDDYYDRLWECQMAPPEKTAQLVNLRDAAHNRLLKLCTKSQTDTPR